MSSRRERWQEDVKKVLSYSKVYNELKFKWDNKTKLQYTVLDTFAGILFMYILVASGICEFTYPWVMGNIDNLHHVFDWLLNNPAGLKLNSQVNVLLASFFRYHVHLWKYFITHMYAASLLPILYVAAATGSTVLVAALHDLISVATMHLMCFNVYTSRLAQVFFTGLTTFWRAFRGKKWNPLRNRVDSLHLDDRQTFMVTTLFIGTVFLLPTIMIYYVVFFTIRIVPMVVQYILDLFMTQFRRLANFFDHPELAVPAESHFPPPPTTKPKCPTKVIKPADVGQEQQQSNQNDRQTDQRGRQIDRNAALRPRPIRPPPARSHRSIADPDSTIDFCETKRIAFSRHNLGQTPKLLKVT
ncbi:unnamed protein product [Bursaphelenchus okinawaensis]|uniref:Uncharacterized protein n=1 Tax=Bursaphelenchus okinawaensis TaxID=465554 RepID=A0A811KSG7_9BILA|nr:unnamed protein product [Bursaphelenchus okinawaensis]CAG9111008.1 unnamed protein product [Bursaphelenchus okinawaensis]